MAEATVAPYSEEPLPQTRPNSMLERSRAALAVILRNRLAALGFLIVLWISLVAILAPHLATHDPFQMNLADRLMRPSTEHWLGTDSYGRDIFTRLVYGGRIAMRVAIGAVLLAVVIGVPLGALSGYAGGWVDTLVMRCIDTFLAFPGRLLAITLVAALGPTFFALCLAIGITSVPGYARVVRAGVLSQKEKEYVEAARMTTFCCRSEWEHAGAPSSFEEYMGALAAARPALNVIPLVPHGSPTTSRGCGLSTRSRRLAPGCLASPRSGSPSRKARTACSQEDEWRSRASSSARQESRRSCCRRSRAVSKTSRA